MVTPRAVGTAILWGFWAAAQIFKISCGILGNWRDRRYPR